MLPECRTPDTTFAIPTFDVTPSDVEGFVEELWEFQSAFHAASLCVGYRLDHALGVLINGGATITALR